MERLGGDRRQGDEPVRAWQRAGGQAEAVHHGRDQDLRSRAGRLYDVVALSGNRSLYEGVLDWTWLGMALGLSYVQIASETMEYISLDIPLGLFFSERKFIAKGMYEGRYHKKSSFSFGFCPHEGGGEGPAQIFWHLFISAFLANKRSLFPPKCQ